MFVILLYLPIVIAAIVVAVTITRPDDYPRFNWLPERVNTRERQIVSAIFVCIAIITTAAAFWAGFMLDEIGQLIVTITLIVIVFVIVTVMGMAHDEAKKQ